MDTFSDPTEEQKERAATHSDPKAAIQRERERARKATPEYRALGAGYNRRLDLRGRCEVCDGPMGIGYRQDGTCVACVTRARDAKWAEIKALWAEGRKMPEIARTLGISMNHLRAEMGRIRQAGLPLPHRYKMENGRRVAA